MYDPSCEMSTSVCVLVTVVTRSVLPVRDLERAAVSVSVSTLCRITQVRVCSLSAGGSAGACVMAAPCDEDESATSSAPSTGGPSHDGASLCATRSSGSPTASRRDAPTVSRGRPRWTSAAASRQPALHTPKVVACETCQRPVSVLAATMPARRAKHVTTPMPVGCQQEGGGVGGLRVGGTVCVVYGTRLWRWRSQL